MIFGFDSDTTETFDRALMACEAIGIDGVTPSILTPFPGTPLYEQYKRKGRLLPVDWSHYNGKTKVAFVPMHMSPEELMQGYDSFRMRFLSWRSILRTLMKSRANLPYALLMNWGYRRAYFRCRRE